MPVAMWNDTKQHFMIGKFNQLGSEETPLEPNDFPIDSRCFRFATGKSHSCFCEPFIDTNDRSIILFKGLYQYLRHCDLIYDRRVIRWNWFKNTTRWGCFFMNWRLHKTHIRKNAERTVWSLKNFWMNREWCCEAFNMERNSWTLSTQWLPLRVRWNFGRTDFVCTITKLIDTGNTCVWVESKIRLSFLRKPHKQESHFIRRDKKNCAILTPSQEANYKIMIPLRYRRWKVKTTSEDVLFIKTKWSIHKYR